MTRRVILGRHPSGPVGLFISRPGIDVATADPASFTSLSFSTQWGQSAALLMAGAVGLFTPVYLPPVVQGSPAVWWAPFDGNLMHPVEIFWFWAGGVNTYSSSSRYDIQFGGAPGSRYMQFVRRNGYDGAGRTIRYIVFGAE